MQRLHVIAEGGDVAITRRNFITQLTVGLASVPGVRWDSWGQGKVKLGYMKIKVRRKFMRSKC
jgi:hypothetical protein